MFLQNNFHVDFNKSIKYNAKHKTNVSIFCVSSIPID